MNKKVLYNKIMESVAAKVKAALNESYEDDLKVYQDKANLLDNILQAEWRKASIDVTAAGPRASFHYGIGNILASKGYIVTSIHDNYCMFFGDSQLFNYYAYKSSKDNKWYLSEKIRLIYNNYYQDVIYSYPYTRKEYSFEYKLNDFKNRYLSACSEIGEIASIKTYRKPSLSIYSYDTFAVYDYIHYGWGGGAYEKVQEFDDFDDAEKAAFNLAQQHIKTGKTGPNKMNYLNTPKDITKFHSDTLVCFEYYNYSESSYYVYVEGEK